MQYSSENLTGLITKSNFKSTEKAYGLVNDNVNYGKLRPFIKASIKFFQTFFINAQNLGFKDRVIFSVLESLEELLIYLKFLKIKKII